MFFFFFTVPDVVLCVCVRCDVMFAVVESLEYLNNTVNIGFSALKSKRVAAKKERERERDTQKLKNSVLAGKMKIRIVTKHFNSDMT